MFLKRGYKRLFTIYDYIKIPPPTIEAPPNPQGWGFKQSWNYTNSGCAHKSLLSLANGALKKIFLYIILSKNSTQCNRGSTPLPRDNDFNNLVSNLFENASIQVTGFLAKWFTRRSLMIFIDIFFNVKIRLLIVA